MATSGRRIRVPVSGFAYLFLAVAVILMLFATLASARVNVFSQQAWTWFFSSLTALLIALIIP
jgi:hypothetical protein